MADYDITQLGSAVEFDTADYRLSTSGGYLKSTRFVLAWQSTTNAKKVQCFSLNRATGAIAAEDSAVTFDNTDASDNAISLTVIDSTHFIVFWRGTDGDGFCRIFSVNDGSGAITAMGAGATEYDTTNGSFPSSCLMDPTHVLNTWYYSSNDDGYAQIFTVNTSTGAITAESSPFLYDTIGESASVAKISDTKALVCYKGASADGFARVLDVNTSTWAVTGAGSSFEFQDNITEQWNNVVIMNPGESPTIAVNFYFNASGGTVGRVLRQLSINTSTWAVSNLGTQLQLYSGVTDMNIERSLQVIDSTHFIVWFVGTADDGFVRTYSINLGTGALTQLNEVEFNTIDNSLDCSVNMGSGLFINAWQDVTSGDGFVQAFQVALPVSTSVKTYYGLATASVKTIDDLAIASRKTWEGLA